MPLLSVFPFLVHLLPSNRPRSLVTKVSALTSRLVKQLQDDLRPTPAPGIDSRSQEN
jgi:hypothetical protein